MSRPWARRGSPEPEVAVANGERVVAVGRTFSGATVAVTADAIYLPGGPERHARLAWDRVVSAGWDDPVLELVESGVGAPHLVQLEQAGRVPEAVRERVTSSIVVTERVDLGPGPSPGGPRGARITGRRTGDGTTLRWTVTFDAGLDASDPELREAADRELARIRATYGA